MSQKLMSVEPAGIFLTKSTLRFHTASTLDGRLDKIVCNEAEGAMSRLTLAKDEPYLYQGVPASALRLS